jgi:NhaP-type Na+/H+ or K+/H+ antiporter
MNDVVLLPIVVLAMLSLSASAQGRSPTAPEIGRAVVSLFLLGPALGAFVGWLGITALARIRDRIGVRRDYESLYALGLAFSGFAAAEAVGGSGFVAAFAAGFMVAAQDVELCDCFLEYGEATAEMLLLLTFVAFGTSLIWTGFAVIDARTLVFAAIALTVRTVVLFPVLAGLGLDERDRRLIALFGPRAARGGRSAAGSTPIAPEPTEVVAPPSALRPPPADVPERITIGELEELQARGEPVTIIDARAARSHRADEVQARGAVRIDPENVVRSATERRLATHGTLVIYCA